MIDHLLTGDLQGDGFWSHPFVAAILGDSLHPGGTALTLEMAEQAGLKTGAHILDVGCGHGTSAQALAAAGYRVTGVDIDPATVQRAQSRNVTDACTFRLTTDDLRGLDGPYDAVLSECALCLTNRPDETLKRFYNLVEPGGSLLLSDVTVEPEAQQFRDAFGFIACLGGALDKTGLERTVEKAGFTVHWSQDRRDLVCEVRDRIHARVDVPALLEALGDERLGAARLVERAERALEDKHLSYRAMVARRPSTEKNTTD